MRVQICKKISLVPVVQMSDSTLQTQHAAFSFPAFFSVPEADCVPLDAIKINATNIQDAE